MFRQIAAGAAVGDNDFLPATALKESAVAASIIPLIRVVNVLFIAAP
jgi:hypothetical protein